MSMIEKLGPKQSSANSPRLWRVGFVGAGYIAGWHAKALQGIPQASLVAICDVSRGRAEALAKKHVVPGVFTSVEDMLAEAQLDAVHVLTPPPHHFTVAQQALEAGANVLIEKPMGVTGEECEALRQLAERKELRLGVGHNFLFVPVYERLRSDVQEHRFGPLDQVTITWHKELGQLRGGDTDEWMLNRTGNVILEVGSHSVAHMIDIAGEPDRMNVDVSREMRLANGSPFFRRWNVTADCGPTLVAINLSLGAGFSEHSVHVRGLAGSAVADFEQGTYSFRSHSPYNMDFDRYLISRREANDRRRQARHAFGRYVLGKFKLSKDGNLFEVSIRRALESFYGRSGRELDKRLSGKFGTSVVRWCQEIAAKVPDGAEASASRDQIVQGAGARKRSGASPAEILVLGGTGFIGKALVRKLVDAGHKVRVLVRSPGKLPAELRSSGIEIIRGDIRNGEDLNRALDGVEIVYHLARADAKTWAEWLEQDVEVTRRVAETCREAKVRRLIYTGTIDSCFAVKRTTPVTEEDGTDPQIAKRNLYARAKAESEALLLALHRSEGFPVVILRPGVVVGSGGSPFHWGVGSWPSPDRCSFWGGGDTPLPLVLVDDVANALVDALDAPGIEGETINLVGGCDLTGRQYVDEVEKAAQLQIIATAKSPWRYYAVDLLKYAVKVAVRHPDRRFHALRDWQARSHAAGYDCTKAERLLNWHPDADRERMISEGIHQPVREWFA